MAKVIVFRQSNRRIGYVARTSTKGEEYDMVSQYINKLIVHYEKLKKKRIAVFIEPQIETGYPDIVIAEFYSSDTFKNKYRDKLKVKDLKILYHIQQQGRTSITQISEELGFSIYEINNSVKRLNKASMVQISKDNKVIKKTPLKKYYKIKNIIAIEAKVNKWSEAIRQAENNIWFSSKSYIMLNKTKCNDSIKKKCIESGIGIILINGKIKTYLVGESRKQPVSYASLQFNEWVYRFLTNGMREENK